MEGCRIDALAKMQVRSCKTENKEKERGPKGKGNIKEEATQRAENLGYFIEKLNVFQAHADILK